MTRDVTIFLEKLLNFCKSREVSLVFASVEGINEIVQGAVCRMTRKDLKDFRRIYHLGISVFHSRLATLSFRSTRARDIDPARAAYMTTSSNSISSVEVKVERTSSKRSAAGAKDRMERR